MKGSTSAKILAFDTSTEVMSIAVQNGKAVFEYEGAGGAKASAQLIPHIQQLMQSAELEFSQLDCIAFGAGPGAFTGLRASCAVAQGLGFAANVMLAPINTLHAVALQRHLATGELKIVAALDARMSETYWQTFDFSQHPLGLPEGEPTLDKNDAQTFVLSTTPKASTWLALATDRLVHNQLAHPSQVVPIYVRNKVAQTTAEREASKHRIDDERQ